LRATCRTALDDEQGEWAAVPCSIGLEAGREGLVSCKPTAPWPIRYVIVDLWHVEITQPYTPASRWYLSPVGDVDDKIREVYRLDRPFREVPSRFSRHAHASRYNTSDAY
jgi:hypothetical protein